MEREKLAHPLLSIVIPTRNRISYAVSSIKSILSIPNNELELVIQDNSDSRELETFVMSLTGDVRLRYNYTPPPFSSIDNFNKAVELATGEYVCIIGDDDGINPELINAARWAKSHNIDAIRTDLIAYYLWPDVQFSISKWQVPGQLTVLPFSCTMTPTNQEEALQQLVDNAGQNYQNIAVPKIYHGLVKRACLDEVRNRTGAYFKGLSPDMFGAISLACVTTRVVSVNYPLTLGGTSSASTAGDSVAGKHKGRLEDAPHFRHRPDYQWSELIPRYYSVQTIWAETAVVALEEMDRQDLLERFNLPLLAAYCILAHPEYASLTLHNFHHSFQARGRGFVIGLLLFTYSVLQIYVRRVHRSILRRLTGKWGRNKPTQYINDLNDIEEASQALARHLRVNNLSFDDCIKGFES
jgi:hypothetical protein